MALLLVSFAFATTENSVEHNQEQTATKVLSSHEVATNIYLRCMVAAIPWNQENFILGDTRYSLANAHNQYDAEDFDLTDNRLNTVAVPVRLIADGYSGQKVLAIPLRA